LAAILFPIFAQARESARAIACISNMRQLGLALRMYSQDYDETYPSERFFGPNNDANLNLGYTWKNAVMPYIKSKGIMACPSNPSATMTPGNKATQNPNGQGEGWYWEPDSLMPISDAMNSTVTTWVPNDQAISGGYSSWVDFTPMSDAKLVRSAQTIAIAETIWDDSDQHVGWTGWSASSGGCDGGDGAGLTAASVNAAPGLMGHRGTRFGPNLAANYTFWDGHAKHYSTAQTVMPNATNLWQIDPTVNPGYPNSQHYVYSWGDDRFITNVCFTEL